MKINNLTLVGLIPVLASSALARPGAKIADDVGTIPEKSRVTAFVSDDDGFRVECWELGDLVESIPSTPQHCDPKDMPRRTQMDVGSGGISGINILTWPSSATIYPPPSGYANTAIDLSAKPNLFTVKDGLIMIEGFYVGSESTLKEESKDVFASKNGDDWFLFDLTPPWGAKHAELPFKVSTISGSESTLINFHYETTPSHTVLHQGRCNFAGLKPAQGGAQDKDLERARMSVQEL